MRRLRRAEGRINSLETSLSRIEPYLNRIEAKPVLFNLPTTGESSSACSTGLELDDFEWPLGPPQVPQEFTEERGSITSLAVACTKIANAKFGGNNQTSGPLARLNSSLRQISELQEQCQDILDIRATIMRPPLSILQAMATTYFDMLNDSFPMFSRSSIEELMKNYDDSGNDNQDVASSLCFNNIILLTLMAKVRRSLAQDVPAVMELEVMKTFLENALAAFGNLESLLHPKLANVQALLSLVRPYLLSSFRCCIEECTDISQSLVCQSMCLTDLARMCLQLVQALWKLLDLQTSLQKSPKSSVIAEEKGNIFWCIFILETSIPMNNSSAVADMPMPLEQPASRGRSHFLAAIHVARLRRNVLDTGTTFSPVHTAQGLAVHHLEELQKLESTLGIDATAPLASGSITNDFHLWITLSCLNARLMINEAFPGSQCRDLILSTAQNAILILLSIGIDTGENKTHQPLLPLYL